MAQLHHASWHLLRTHKQKTRVRHYSKAHIGNLQRRFEAGSIRLKEAEERVKGVRAALGAVVAATPQEVSHG